MDLNVVMTSARIPAVVSQATEEVAKRVLSRAMKASNVHTVNIIDRDTQPLKPRYPDGGFNIFLDSYILTPYSMSGKVLAPDQIWKTTSNMYDNHLMYTPSGEGMLIIDSTSDTVVAEYTDYNLYILLDPYALCCIANRGWLYIFEQILKETLLYLPAGPPQICEIYDGRFRIPKIADIKDMVGDLRYLRDQLAKHVGTGTELYDQLAKISDTDPSERVLKQLARIPEIKTMSIKKQSITIVTYTMYAEDRSRHKIHELGPFRITLNFGENASAEFRNQGHRYGGYGHPHVDRDREGYWCMGEGSAILDLLKTFEFEAAILFAIKAIESVNPRPDYLSILRQFPIVEERLKYPKAEAELDEHSKESFLKMYSDDNDGIHKRILGKIRNFQNSAKGAQSELFLSVFGSTLIKELADPNGARNLTEKLQSQIKELKDFPWVDRVTIRDDLVGVRTVSMVITDTDTQEKFRVGPFGIAYNFSDGTVKVQSERPFMVNGQIYQAPQIPNEDGDLILSQLTMTLPELMGELEVATCTELFVNYIATFSSVTLGVKPPETLRVIK
ncbi:hypothetical protein IPM19_03445 [bacterium]|nr:MAG: hypothetical protein IPM19_03445 [bacterium]